MKFIFLLQIFQQKVSKPTKTSRKVHSFYNTAFLNKPFYEPQIIQQCKKTYSPNTAKDLTHFTYIPTRFQLVSEKETFALHHFQTPKNCILEAFSNKCLYIPKKISLQLLSDRLSNLLKLVPCCLSVVKCLKIFCFN